MDCRIIHPEVNEKTAGIASGFYVKYISQPYRKQ